MNKILTIVIPSYNTSKYIDDCVPTFLAAKKVLNDIELLFINDGSIDDTQSKIESYQRQYPDTIRLINKKNGGHGSALNVGIDEAAGKYLAVVDGDDWVLPKNLTKLVSYLKTIDADMVLYPWVMFHVMRNKKTLIKSPVEYDGVVRKFEDVVDTIPQITIHSVTFKTKMLRDSKVRIREKCYYVDAGWNLFFIPYIQTVALFDLPIVIYRIGTSTQSTNLKNAAKNKKMLILIHNDQVDFYNGLPKSISDKRRKYILGYLSNGNYSVYLRMRFGKKARKELYAYDEELKNKSRELYDNCSSLAIRLLRKRSWLTYTAAFIVYRIRHIILGF